jgi:hypothetical protein
MRGGMMKAFSGVQINVAKIDSAVLEIYDRTSVTDPDVPEDSKAHLEEFIEIGKILAGIERSEDDEDKSENESDDEILPNITL